MFDIDNPGGLLEAECQIGDTRFHLDKMGAMEAWRVLEVIRKEASNVAGLPITDLMTQLRGATMDDAIRIGAKVAMAVIGLPVPFVEGLRKTLFKHVRFTGNGAQTPQMLDGRRGHGVQRAGAGRHLRGAGAESRRKFYAFLRWPGRSDLQGRSPEWTPVETSLIPPLFSAIIAAPGLPDYIALRDRVTLDEVPELVEYLMVRSENEHRAREAAQAKAKR